MPNFQPYEGGNLSLRPTEVGVEARAGTARRIGMFSNQQASAEEMLARETSRLGSETSRLGSETSALGSEKGAALADTGRRLGSSIADAGAAAVQYLDHQQISQGAPAFARLMAQKTEAWNETVKDADPNDPTVAQKFMDSLEPELAKFKYNGFYTEGGQKWAEAHVDALRQHMAEKTQADMATLAGHAAVVNQQQTINSLSSTVHSDPTSLDFSLAALRSSTEGMISSSPNLTGVQASAARSEILQKGAEAIVKSAAIGYIEKTAKIPPWISDPKYAPYVNGAELKTLESAAKSQAKVNAYYDKQTEITQRQINERKAEGAANQSLTNNVKIDPQSSRPVIDPQFFKDALEIAKMPDAPQGLARTLIDWGESQQNKERRAVTDPAVASTIDGRMFASDNPTSKMDVLRAEADGKLSRADAEIRSKIIDQRDKLPSDPQFKIATDGARQLIEGRTPGEKMLQSGKYAAFMQQFLEDYQRQKMAGTLPPNALSLRDPTSLLSKTMEAYKSPMAAAIGGNGGIGAVPPKREDAMPAIPPADQRPPGLYETPKGKLRWTGTGWVQP